MRGDILDDDLIFIRGNYKVAKEEEGRSNERTNELKKKKKQQ